MPTRRRPVPSAPEASKRTQRVRQSDTSDESALRLELYASGLPYRVQVPVLKKPRRVADVAFSGLRVAVFVDGCFWHGCPQHATSPKANADFWRSKILANGARDLDTDRRLREDGWVVVRAWAHEYASAVAARVARVIRSRRRAGSSVVSRSRSPT